LLYTNHPKMKEALCRSLIRMDGESDSDLKSRHCHFYHFGKSLRESVDAFGVEAHSSESDLRVIYHGMPLHDLLRRSDSVIDSLYILVPFSATSLLEIGHRDCSENGVLLAMKGFVIKYFDCSWISDFHHEAERLFFGGERALTISQCIDSKFGFDHHRIMSAVTAMYRVFTASNSMNLEISDSVKQTVRKLIERRLYRQQKLIENEDDGKEKEIETQSKLELESNKNMDFNDHSVDLLFPDDVEEELRSFWSTTTTVTMHYDAMYDGKAFSFLSSLLMTKTRTFVRCDVLQTVFPNICSLKMSGLPLTSLTLFYLKSVIKNQNGKLLEIEMINPKTTAMSISAVIEAEKRNLAEMQWTIESLDDSSLNLKYSEVPVVIKEPTPPQPDDHNDYDELKEKEGAGNDGNDENSKPKKVVTVRRKVIRKRIVKRKKVVVPEQNANLAAEGQTD